MKLKWKCALFLLAVMSCQLLVFGSLLSYIGQKDEQADRVSYYNRLLSTISTLSRDVQACELSLFMFVNLQDSNSLSELNHLTHELKTRLDKIDNSWIKQQDSHEMMTILSESRYLSGGFSKLRSKGKTEFEANGSKLDDAFQRGTEIMRAGERLRVRNQQLLSEQTEDDYKDIFIVFVICAFAVNLSATILLFGFFLRTVVSRMDKVTDNFSRLNNDEPLHSRQRGSDEISRLDREFHIMAASLERATMKGSRAFAGTPVGLLTVNDDGMVESMNPCAARMCGEIRDIGSPITPELKSLADIRTHASQKRVAIQSPDGTTFPAEVAIASYMSNGENKHMVSILDVSEQAEIEQLQREFISVVSQDIRAPLTSIQACLSLFLDGSLGELDKDATKNVRLALHYSEELIDLTKTHVDIARLESGTMELSFRYLGIDTLFGIVIDNLKNDAEKKGVLLEAVPSDSAIKADPDRTVQIMENLLRNAIERSAEGDSVKLFTAMESDFVVIKVQDQGNGIGKEQQLALFDRFNRSRLDGTLNAPDLVLSRLLAESQGGSLKVHSELVKGSTFWLRLPKHRDHLQSSRS